MELVEHACELGKLLGNLQSLELALRSFLYPNADPPHNPAPAGVSLLAPAVSETLPENAFTDWSSLGQLIDRYNRIVKTVDPTLLIDRSVVDLRDMLAHGRLSAASPSPPLRLVKFDRPSRGKVRVTASEELTLTWLTGNVTRVRSELAKVERAMTSNA